MNGVFNYQVPGYPQCCSQNKAPANQGNNVNQSSHNGSSSNFGESINNNLQLLTALISILKVLINALTQNTPRDGGDNQPPDVTTLALGEEDGGNSTAPPVATTLALGEEDGGGVTTFAIGEEDGGNGNSPIATTLALGEEDGGIVTTHAIGEENGNGFG